MRCALGNELKEMRISIQSDYEIIDLFKGLELLTNFAQVKLASIMVDEFRNVIAIPMRRRSYQRKRFLFIGERYKLLSPQLINSNLVIRNIIDHREEDNLRLPEIQLLFGVNVKNKEILLCSVEEHHGVAAFRMNITVQTYDIELRDEKKGDLA